MCFNKLLLTLTFDFDFEIRGMDTYYLAREDDVSDDVLSVQVRPDTFVTTMIYAVLFLIYHGTIQHDNASGTTTSKVKLRSDFELTKDTHTSP